MTKGFLTNFNSFKNVIQPGKKQHLMKFCLAVLNNVQYYSRTMNNKETIIEETTKLIETYQGDISKITIREISGRIHISVGLINYHFENKRN